MFSYVTSCHIPRTQMEVRVLLFLCCHIYVMFVDRTYLYLLHAMFLWIYTHILFVKMPCMLTLNVEITHFDHEYADTTHDK